MRYRMAFFSLALVAAAGLLAATAMAADPDPLDDAYKTCTFQQLTIQTDGPVACGDNTCITYNLSGSGTLDHIGTFVRAEATPTIIGDVQSTVTDPCTSGDSVLGLGIYLMCFHLTEEFRQHPSSRWVHRRADPGYRDDAADDAEGLRDTRSRDPKRREMVARSRLRAAWR